jgi:hypothetical protein
MNSEGLFAGTTSSTSAGTTKPSVLRTVFLCSVLGAASVPGTSAGNAFDSRAARPATSRTDAGQLQMRFAERVAGIDELRRLTGFTWDQVAELFGVSRRAAHHWSSGKPMAAGNDEHLQRTLGCLRAIDRGSALANREALFASASNGKSAVDLLMARQYDQVIALLGNAVDFGRTPTLKVRVSAARLPLPPQVLAGALEETVHREAGPRRPARVVKVRRGA